MPNFYPNIYNQYPQMQAQQPQMIQDGGFVPVPNEQVARNYPVGFGKSVTFKDENSPYIYTKTMGFSQLDRPIFEKYRLVKEEEVENRMPKAEDNDPAYVTKLEFDSVCAKLEELTRKFEELRRELGDEYTADVISN